MMDDIRNDTNTDPNSSDVVDGSSNSLIRTEWATASLGSGAFVATAYVEGEVLEACTSDESFDDARSRLSERLFEIGRVPGFFLGHDVSV